MEEKQIINGIDIGTTKIAVVIAEWDKVENKIDILGVKKATLKKHGAVSSEVAEQMAKGVRKKFKSDIGVGITGIAGPTGGSKEKPVGLTFIGLDVNGEVKVTKAVFTNDRRYNKELAVQSALNLVRIALL